MKLHACRKQDRGIQYLSSCTAPFASASLYNKRRREFGAEVWRQGRTVPAGQTHWLSKRLASCHETSRNMFRILLAACSSFHNSFVLSDNDAPHVCKCYLHSFDSTPWPSLRCDHWIRTSVACWRCFFGLVLANWTPRAVWVFEAQSTQEAHPKRHQRRTFLDTKPIGRSLRTWTGAHGFSAQVVNQNHLIRNNVWFLQLRRLRKKSAKSLDAIQVLDGNSPAVKSATEIYLFSLPPPTTTAAARPVR